VPSCVVSLLIYLIIMSLVLLAVMYFFFISSTSKFSLDLSSIINAGSIPQLGSLVFCAIRSTIMGTSLSNQISPPFVTTNSYIIHAVTYWPLPKCGSFSNPKMHVRFSPIAHWCGWLIVSPSWLTTIFFIKTLGAISRYLVSSNTSCSEYLSFPTWPISCGSTCTPSGMHGSMIFAIGFLWSKLGIRTLSFDCGGWYKVPTLPSCCSISHYGQAEVVPVVSSVGWPRLGTCTSSGFTYDSWFYVVPLPFAVCSMLSGCTSCWGSTSSFWGSCASACMSSSMASACGC